MENKVGKYYYLYYIQSPDRAHYVAYVKETMGSRVVLDYGYPDRWKERTVDYVTYTDELFKGWLVKEAHDFKDRLEVKEALEELCQS